MKIHIFGASGSGVTTLGKLLSKELSLIYFDTDDYYWEQTNPPFIKANTRETRQLMLRESLSNYINWILGGSLDSWGDFIKDEFDLVVFLWLPKEVRVERLKKREYDRYGEVIFDNKDRNKQYLDFINWASDYDLGTKWGRNLERHKTWIKTLNCPVMRIEDDHSNEQRIELIKNYLKEIKTTNKS